MRNNNLPAENLQGACPKCGSLNTTYKKWIFGSPASPKYHIRKDCNDCRGKTYVKRDKFAYEATKNSKWYLSKKYLQAKNRELQMTI